MLSHRSLKFCGAFLCVLVFANIVWSMSHWNEARGVYDDICYLRQAHLFQRFGLSGFDTNLARDDDGYFSAKVKEIGLPGEAKICHTLMLAAHKSVLQYPPGTGFVLAAFPAGFQVVPLNISTTTLILFFALLAICLAGTNTGIVASSVLGSAAIYFMINPAKASYSVAPTMVVCAAAGFLTAWLFKSRRVGTTSASDICSRIVARHFGEFSYRQSVSLRRLCCLLSRRLCFIGAETAGIFAGRHIRCGRSGRLRADAMGECRQRR